LGCCLSGLLQYPTEHCGWTSSITKTNQQTVSWSDTTEVGFHMTWNVNAGPAIKLGDIGFEVKNSFSTGQSITTSSSQTYSSGCLCDSDHCTAPFTELDYELNVVYSTQPVQITAKKCGVTKNLPGTVKTSQFMGKYQFLIQNVTSCSRGTAPVVV